MKTRNNVQKATFKPMVFAAVLIVAGFSVDGQGATKSEIMIDNSKSLAFAHVKMPVKAAATTSGTNASYAAYLAPAVEEPLSVEQWMKEESRFESKALEFEQATEEGLRIENWMTDEKNFTATEKQGTLKPVKFEVHTSTFVYRESNFEEALTIEPWMLDAKIWK